MQIQVTDPSANGYMMFKALLTVLRNVAGVFYVLQTQSGQPPGGGIIVQAFLSGGAIMVGYSTGLTPPTFHTDFPDAIEEGPTDTSPFACVG